MSSERVTAALAAYTAAAAALAELDYDQFTHPELLDLLDELETVARQLPTLDHRLLARLQREASPVELGAKSLKAVLRIRLRISGQGRRPPPRRSRRVGTPHRPERRTAAAACWPRSPTPKPTAASAPNTSRLIRTFFDKLPAWVDPTTREQAETSLTRIADGSDPDVLRKAAERLATADRSGRPRTRRHRTRPQANHHPGPATTRRDEPHQRLGRPAVPRHLRTHPGQTRRPRHVQPRRREPLHHRHPRPSPDRRRHPQLRATHPRRVHRDRAAQHLSLRGTRPAQRPTRHHRGHHHPARPPIRRRLGASPPAGRCSRWPK